MRVVDKMPVREFQVVAPHVKGPVDAVALVGQDHAVQVCVSPLESRIEDIPDKGADHRLHVGIRLGDSFRHVALQPDRHDARRREDLHGAESGQIPDDFPARAPQFPGPRPVVGIVLFSHRQSARLRFCHLCSSPAARRYERTQVKKTLSVTLEGGSQKPERFMKKFDIRARGKPYLEMRTDGYGKKESNKHRSQVVKTEQTKPQTFKKINATKKMKEIMEQHFRELDEAAKTKSHKIAWCTSVGPAELLRAAGFLVFFPENHGAMLGATRMATDLIPVANAIGYSPDICSYLTSDIGAYLKGESPISKAYPGISGPPRPDVLVYNTNQCRDVHDWFNFYGREFNVPVIGVQTHRGVGDITKAHVDSISAQIKALVPTLEEISGKKLDFDEFKRVVGFSRQCTDLWKEVLQIASNVPSPLTFFDGTIQMGPAVVLRGEQRAVDYYKLLLAELKQRVKDGVAAIDGEQFRLYWEGMPIWGKLRELSTQFAELNTCVLASTYCSSWVFPALDPDDPFDSMARAYIELFIVRDENYKENYFEKQIDRYKIDGMIFHDAKTCPNNSNNRYGMPERLAKKYNMPMLIIHGDLNDLRCYSEEQARTNIEAFIEQLAEKKGR